MKKTLAILLALSMTAALPLSANAEANTLTESKPEGTTDITTSITPAYTVTIPADTTVQFGATSTDFGEIRVTKAQLDPGANITVSLTASGAMKNEADANATLPYTIKAGDAEFESAEYDAVGEYTELTIDITENAWNAAYAGDYKDTVIFNVSYSGDTQITTPEP